MSKYNRFLRRLYNLAVLFFCVMILCRLLWTCIRPGVGGFYDFINSTLFWGTGLAAIYILTGAVYLLIFDHIRLDRILSGGKLKNILLVITVIIAVPVTIHFIMVSAYGWSKIPIGTPEMMGEEMKDTPGLLWTIVYYFIDPGNQHMAITHRSQIWAMITGIAGVTLMSGLLVSSITNLFDRRGDGFLMGTCRYKYNFAFGKFVVIIGGHEMVIRLCKDLIEKQPDLNHIFILTSSNIEALRRNLNSVLGEDERMVLYYGDRSNESELEALHYDRAEAIYVIGEEEEEPLHDALNMKCIQYMAKHTRYKIKCFVLFENQTTFTAFQASDIRSLINEKLEFIPFNFYETWAQKVCSEYKPIDATGLPYSASKRVHIVISGMSKMGIALALECAHTAQYPNIIRENKLRTKITFIDPNAQEEMEYFMGRFKGLKMLSKWRFCSEENMQAQWNIPEQDFLDIEWEFIKGGIQAPHIQEYLKSCCMDEQALITMAVTIPDTNQALASVLYLPAEVYESDAVQQVLVYQPKEAAMVNGINAEGMRFCKLKPFGMKGEGHIHPMIFNDPKPAFVEGIYDMVWDLKNGEKGVSENKNPIQYIRERFAETGLKNWETAKIWAKWSNIYNAETLKTKLKSAEISNEEYNRLAQGISFDNNGKLIIDKDKTGNELYEKLHRLATVEHNRWNMEKLLMGYRALTPNERKKCQELYGSDDFEKYKNELKNGIQRAHLDICPFEDLPCCDPGIEDYDYIISVMIPDILKQAEN